MLPIPTRSLSDGRVIPVLGFGTYPMDDAEAEIAVATALDLGYRLIDTASLYGNELGVGRGLARSGVERSEMFVTTKLRGGEHGFDQTIAGLKDSLTRLDLDYVDLYLIHWPLPRVNKYVDSWRAMIRLRDEGLIRSIGVSNFNEAHLERLAVETGVVPVVNQIELHPAWAQSHLREVDARYDIVTESWSPLGRDLPMGDYPAVADAAVRHHKTPAQIVLRWQLQIGALPIPKASSIQHQRENLDVFSFELSSEEMAAIAAIAQSRMDEDPEVFEEF
ncbi:MAG TPA: aldo/keto reductase [Acidimicrobiales bacterium]|nr:aldo/keto reductase [Acidimicrobiales bacterium]